MHILQITNHGLHEWQVTPGLPDTGGQNVYVNHLSAAFVRLGHQVTIVNRGGYPHPLTGEMRIGAVGALEGQVRIVYLADGTPSFVRKEDMGAQVPELAARLTELMDQQHFDLILSHYWDGALLGVVANRAHRLPHYWIPHSLGAIKRRNVDPARYAELRIDDRIAVENTIVAAVDGVVATSAVIRGSVQHDYGSKAEFFLPPGVDYERFRPRPAADCDPIWDFIADRLGTDSAVVRGRPLILEVSRTDTTKRKDVLLRAFATVANSSLRPLLAVTIDDINETVHRDLMDLIEALGVGDDVAVLGSVWDQLPCLYSEAAIYCTPSIMEGFGMSAAEAAAAATPVVASDLVPFAVEHLLGPEAIDRSISADTAITVGAGGIVAPADSVEGFAAALEMLLADHELRARLGDGAYRITVPDFGWDQLAASFLDSVHVASDV